METLPDSKVYVIAGCDLQQKDLNDIIKGKWLSDVHIHTAEVLFKRKYPVFTLQINTHWCKDNVIACENTIFHQTYQE